ncbi:MAG: hypothetical protein HDS35_06150 [Bacteroides sp.]|nr:hypothetical protein [Bacteroides sp.]
MTREETIGFLDADYQRLQRTGEDRCQILATIIALKQIEDQTDYRQSIYVDAKQWIRFFFEDLTDKDFGYDQFSLANFSPIIDRFPNDQALSLYLYIRHLCTLHEFDITDIDEKIELLKLGIWKDKRDYVRIGLYLIANRTKWIISITVVYILVVALCFLSAPTEWMECIEVSEFQWPGESWWVKFSSYLSTVLYYIFHGATDSPIVIPLNFRGVILIGILEFSFWGLIVNFLYQRVIQYLQSIGLTEIS